MRITWADIVVCLLIVVCLGWVVMDQTKALLPPEAPMPAAAVPTLESPPISESLIYRAYVNSHQCECLRVRPAEKTKAFTYLTEKGEVRTTEIESKEAVEVWKCEGLDGVILIPTSVATCDKGRTKR